MSENKEIPIDVHQLPEQLTVPGTQIDRVCIEALDEALKEWKELEEGKRRAAKKFKDHKGHVHMLMVQHERRKYVLVANGKELEFELKGGDPEVQFHERDVGAPRRGPRRSRMFTPRIVAAPERPPSQARGKKSTKPSKPFNPPRLKPAKKTKPNGKPNGRKR